MQEKHFVDLNKMVRLDSKTILPTSVKWSYLPEDHLHRVVQMVTARCWRFLDGCTPTLLRRC
jgi:hypothetical protein